VLSPAATLAIKALIPQRTTPHKVRLDERRRKPVESPSRSGQWDTEQRSAIVRAGGVRAPVRRPQS